MLRGSDQATTGTLDPLAAWASVPGGAEQGPDWDVALGDQSLLVGIPQSNIVASYSLDAGGVLSIASGQGHIVGDTTGEELGAAVALLGDFDGDGLADLLVGAPSARQGVDVVDQGAVLLFSGDGAGIHSEQGSADAALRVEGTVSGARLGSRLAACGDVDGDGLADWAAAAPWASGDAVFSGFVVLGRSGDLAGLSGTVAADLVPSAWWGEGIGARAGSSLACAHDLTGDGLADLVVGVPFADGAGEARGMVHLLPGGASMPAGGTSHLLRVAAARSFEGIDDEDWLGSAVATGDIDADGTMDLVAGAPGASGLQGEARLWLGPSRGGTWGASAARILGEAPGDAFGSALALADMNGDSSDDLLVGAPHHNPDPAGAVGAYNSGTLYQLNGAPSLLGWSRTMGADQAQRRWSRSQQYLSTGQHFGIGDFDADGILDLVLLHRARSD